MNRVLVLFAHPVYQRSLLNKSLIAQYKNIENLTFHDLYEEYPNFMIDIQTEQDLLNSHDVVIFQHPLYWYSSPALLKEWVDLVLQHGYAYGSDAKALKGKIFMSVVTTGGDSVNYQQNESVRNLLQPFEKTAEFCGMQALPPFLLQGGLRIKAKNFDHKFTEEVLVEHAKTYKQLINDLVNNEIDVKNASQLLSMNEWYLNKNSNNGAAK